MDDSVGALVSIVLGLGLIAGAAVTQSSREAEREPPTAQRLEEDCNDGDAKACYELGLTHGKEGPEQDLRAARRYVQKSCDLQHAPACELLRDMVDPEAEP